MTVISDNDPLPAAKPRQRRLEAVHLLPVLALTVAAALVGCSQEKTDTIHKVDSDAFPTMRTVNVSTLVSDSGFTRYHITAPVWLMFDNAQDPHWSFPEGLDMERYDDNKSVEATFCADSATYFNARRLWRFDGNVRMRNTGGDRFATEQLFWDQQNGKVYSDSFIHIERPDRILEGVGFESNEQMDEFEILNVQGIFPVPERRDSTARSAGQTQPVDSLGPDTLRQGDVAEPRSRKSNQVEP